MVASPARPCGHRRGSDRRGWRSRHRVSRRVRDPVRMLGGQIGRLGRILGEVEEGRASLLVNEFPIPAPDRPPAFLRSAAPEQIAGRCRNRAVEHRDQIDPVEGHTLRLRRRGRGEDRRNDVEGLTTACDSPAFRRDGQQTRKARAPRLRNRCVSRPAAGCCPPTARAARRCR